MCFHGLSPSFLSPDYDRDIDKVDDLMAEVTEQHEVAQEISDVISRPIGLGDDIDEVRTTCNKCSSSAIVAVDIVSLLLSYQRQYSWENEGSILE